MDQVRGLSADHLEAALEASCSALRALEVSKAEMAATTLDLGGAQSDTREAIDLLRHVIGSLRSASGAHAPPAPVALGFVLDRGDAQSSPDRTA